ncbi:1-acyl-sn-glycerol-3-phosphate acyltransferase [Phenylobacterium sp.]|uniref:lysophospholipid acyltransferase family protein n=1 Tax=Phenylobacterium sp. TaxID=1871053 RepID=UPI0025FFC011|nr:lysophospholipid acyltransferase family protein [Phenylobacterium sp.]MBX3482571.1 1-acyl-sn-glycerol-3-phosphate acyltransferase [Phenylobacterium sp.]MCW5760244.1 1-acyl-sn-glycerol-3-phosphate acyltransferase [Phenylobacterium sp.]
MTAIRSLIYVALFYLWTAVVAVGCTPLLLGPQRWTFAMFNVWGRGVTAMLPICGIRVEVRGQQHIPTGAALVAPKHQCMLDVFAQFAWLPRSCFVMKKELAWIPWFSWYGMKAGAIVIDREGGSKTMRQVIREGAQRFRNGQQVVTFPEGHRQPPGAPPDYKPGIAALYRELNVPVYPVATNAGVHWPAHGFIRRPGLIVFEYLEPIPPGLKRAEFMRLLEERIETRSNELLAL